MHSQTTAFRPLYRALAAYDNLPRTSAYLHDAILPARLGLYEADALNALERAPTFKQRALRAPYALALTAARDHVQGPFEFIDALFGARPVERPTVRIDSGSELWQWSKNKFFEAGLLGAAVGLYTLSYAVPGAVVGVVFGAACVGLFRAGRLSLRLTGISREPVSRPEDAAFVQRYAALGVYTTLLVSPILAQEALMMLMLPIALEAARCAAFFLKLGVVAIMGAAGAVTGAVLCVPLARAAEARALERERFARRDLVLPGSAALASAEEELVRAANAALREFERICWQKGGVDARRQQPRALPRQELVELLERPEQHLEVLHEMMRLGRFVELWELKISARLGDELHHGTRAHLQRLLQGLRWARMLVQEQQTAYEAAQQAFIR